MAIGTPVNLGNTGALGAGTATTVTTTGSAPAGSLIIVSVAWYHATATTAMSGGGLTWTTADKTQAGTVDTARHCSVFSAQAPAGLAASTVLTATHSLSSDNRHMAVAYDTGLATASPVDITGSATGITAAWSAGATTGNADDLLWSACFCEPLKTNTAAGTATELHDFQNATSGTTFCTEYEIVATAGAKVGSGTWNTAPSEYVAVFVAYKAAAVVAASAFQTFGPRRTAQLQGPYNFVEARRTAAPVAPPATVTVKRLPATGVG